MKFLQLASLLFFFHSFFSITTANELANHKERSSSFSFLQKNGLWDPFFRDGVLDIEEERVHFSYNPIAIGDYSIPLIAELEPFQYHFRPAYFKEREWKIEYKLLLPFPEEELSLSKENREEEEKLYQFYLKSNGMMQKNSLLQKRIQFSILSLLGAFVLSFPLLLLSSYLLNRYQTQKASFKKYKIKKELEQLALLKCSDSFQKWGTLLAIIKNHFSDSIPIGATIEEMELYSVVSLSDHDWKRVCRILHKRRYSMEVSEESEKEFQSLVHFFYSYLEKL